MVPAAPLPWDDGWCTTGAMIFTKAMPLTSRIRITGHSAFKDENRQNWPVPLRSERLSCLLALYESARGLIRCRL